MQLLCSNSHPNKVSTFVLDKMSLTCLSTYGVSCFPHFCSQVSLLFGGWVWHLSFEETEYLSCYRSPRSGLTALAPCILGNWSLDWDAPSVSGLSLWERPLGEAGVNPTTSHPEAENIRVSPLGCPTWSVESGPFIIKFARPRFTGWCEQGLLTMPSSIASLETAKRRYSNHIIPLAFLSWNSIYKNMENSFLINYLVILEYGFYRNRMINASFFSLICFHNTELMS